MLKEDELQRMETLKKQITAELKKLSPEDVESIVISLVEDLWDEMEMTTDPTLVSAYTTVDNYLTDEGAVRWGNLLEAIATLEAYRRIKRREPIVAPEF